MIFQPLSPYMFLGGRDSYRNHPGIARSRPVYLSDSSCNSSSAEAGVLIGHGLIPPVGSTHYHRKRTSPSHYCTHQGSETPLTSLAASHPCTPVTPSGIGRKGPRFHSHRVGL
ncbi:hypothetical protein AVEN_166425-1 [Araneus ventricosus]|uniref:Uncharacterized protein n=1 Tax=Araneus ventricosus TaxID=182803 RepID=A0A4Y2EXL4_ARAVE|nr:hypothetical protein AVEN_166425-1 [Araneus ventricosus]